MSHCANYLLRTNGTLYQGNTRWGSKSLVRELVWGPDEALAFLAELTGAPPFDADEDSSHADTRGWIYSEVMTEGAVYADYDARRLLVFGGEDIRYDRMLQIGYESILRRAWPAWQVDYAMGGWADIATAAGVPVQPFDHDRDRGFATFDTIELSSSPGSLKRSMYVLVSLVDGARVVHAHVKGYDDELFATDGASLVAFLESTTSQPLVEATCLARAGLLVDRAGRRVSYWAHELDAMLPELLAAKWPDYSLHRISGPLAQVALAGGDPASIALRMDAIRAQVVAELGYDGSGLEQIVSDIRDRAKEPNVSVATGATTLPPSVKGDRATRLAELLASFDPDERMSTAK